MQMQMQIGIGKREAMPRVQTRHTAAKGLIVVDGSPTLTRAMLGAAPVKPKAARAAVADQAFPHSILSRFFSPKTKLEWLPRKSMVVGASSFLYCLPFFWGGWIFWPIQALFSFMSDYVMTGRDSWWHPADRCLATGLTIFIIPWVAAPAIGWPQTIAGCTIVFTAYGLSVRAMARRRFREYEIAHSAWHISGSLAICYVMSHIQRFNLRPCAARGTSDWPAISFALQCGAYNYWTSMPQWYALALAAALSAFLTTRHLTPWPHALPPTTSRRMQFAPCICAAGLLPYAVLAMRSRVSAAIVVNGLLFHLGKASRHPLTQAALQWDFLWNAYFMIDANVHTGAQPEILCLSTVACMSFVLNDLYLSQTRPVVSAIVHVLMTQWITAVAMWLNLEWEA